MYTAGPDMSYDRYYHGCTLFKSAKHGNREVALVAGGYVQEKVELLDYQAEGSAWEESK